MSLPQTPKNIVSLKSIRNVPKPNTYAVDLYERLTSKSLHTIEELKDMCRTLFLTFNQEANQDFEAIFNLEKELREHPALELDPIDLNLTSTQPCIFFNPKKYEKIPISEYHVVDNTTFSSGPFYHSTEISKKVTSQLQEEAKSFFDYYSEHPEGSEEEEEEDEESKPALNQLEAYYYTKLIYPSLAADFPNKDQPSSPKKKSPQNKAERSPKASPQAEDKDEFPSFTATDKLKEALLNIHFILPTVIQRGQALRQDRQKLIERMKQSLENAQMNEGVEEEEIDPESQIPTSTSMSSSGARPPSMSAQTPAPPMREPLPAETTPPKKEREDDQVDDQGQDPIEVNEEDEGYDTIHDEN